MFIFFACSHCIAQRDTAYRFIKAIRADAVSLTVDNLDNLYILTSSDQLKKFNENGDSVAVYNDVKRFGKLHSIEVSNPLKLLLYYKDFSTIVILDRLLASRGSIDLRKLNILQTSAVGISYDNNIWLFDEYNNRLKKINEEGNTLMETSDFRMLFGQSVLPQQIIDKDGLVYLYDVNNGLFVFDHYGTFKRKIPVTKWKNISITDKLIYGLHDQWLQSYNTSTLMQHKHSLPETSGSFLNYIIVNTKLFAVAKDSVNIYTYKF
ncbi:MAG: hypothetical protein ABR502_05385 [Chitinophagaceae bacterium]